MSRNYPRFPNRNLYQQQQRPPPPPQQQQQRPGIRHQQPSNNFTPGGNSNAYGYLSDQRPPYQHPPVNQNVFARPPSVGGNFTVPPSPTLPHAPMFIPPSIEEKKPPRMMNMAQNRPQFQNNNMDKPRNQTNNVNSQFHNNPIGPNIQLQQPPVWLNINNNDQRPPLNEIPRGSYTQPRFIPPTNTNMPFNRMLTPNIPRPPIPPGDFLSRRNIPLPDQNMRFPPVATHLNPARLPFFPTPEVKVNHSPNAPPNFLPLPPPTVKDVPNKDSISEYKQIMVDIVQKWIQSRNISTLDKAEDSGLMKLQEFREHLFVFVGLIEKLRTLNDSLAENMEAEKEVWEKLMQDVTKTKKEVIDLQYKLFNPKQTKFITNLQKNRRKKRERIRRKKKIINENYVVSLSKRIQLNERIDEALQKERTKIAMEKRDETFKTTAGESLVEVKHKQNQVSQFIEVCQLLKQLREIRKKTAIYQGIFVTEKDDEKFHGKVESASELLKTNAKIYENEEWALRTLREEEAQEMNRVEKEKRKKRKENRQEQLTQVDPMFPFRLFWKQGEDSVAGLVHVRRMWDFSLCPPITPGGTRIPKSFVEPSKPCNKEWAKYLVKKPKLRKRKSDFGGTSSTKD